MSLRRALPAIALAALLAGPGAVSAAGGDRLADEAGVRYLDVRDGPQAEALAEARTEDERPAGMEQAARRLVRAQGAMASLELDPTTGTVRSLGDLAGTLTGPSDTSPVRTARDYVRANRVALGLTGADLQTLRLDSAETTSDGVTHVRWIQAIDGVPAFDNGLTVDLDRGNRILGVGGSPLHAPDPNTTTPEIGRAEAIERFAARVGTMDGGEESTAKLVLFDVNGRLRLAWRIQHRAAPTEHYDAVLDATSGRLLHRANLVKFLSASVFRHYPGAAQGGTQSSVVLDQYLLTTTQLFGPYAFAYSDVDDSNTFQASENVNPSTESSAFTDFPSAGGCTLTALCSWDHATPASWTTNRAQNAIQAFWFVNTFRDHLASAPIDFRGFECIDPGCEGATDDPVVVNTDDGAATGGAGPDADHVNNANMSTPPDGSAPLMQMYLFRNGSGSPFRDVNGGDSAEIVYHEYTHGLSNRLVINASGAGALNSPQSGAMGEAWSDWYAMDYLNRPDAGSLVPDTATPGEVDLGEYTDASPNQIRSQPLDCAVGNAAPECPGAGSAGAGGYTYGDFGKICSCGPQVHADGEIWAETLWDLRTRLIAALGVTAGSDMAERLVTGAMRLSPPEPSFLDMRNAILRQDTALGGNHRSAIWDVFTARGMGFFAGTLSGDDVAPLESFDPRPADNGPTGSLAGTVTDELTGTPVPGATVSIGGHTSGEITNVFTTLSGANGAFTLASVPHGTYRKVLVGSTTGYNARVARDVAVTGTPGALNVALRRDWSSLAGGGAIASDNDDTGTAFGCGPAALINQSQGAGWSPYNPSSLDYPAPTPENHLVAGASPSATIRLPRPVDISAFGADPGATCGDGASATTRQFRIETSRDGVAYDVAYDGSGANAFVPADAGTLKSLVPTAAGAGAVRFVRLTLLSPQDDCAGCSGRDFIDFSELEVFGNGLPTGSLSVPAAATAGQQVALDASSFTDDGSIASYGWDYDGNGTVDQTTATPTTTHVYAAGSFSPTVRVTDNNSGSSTAAAPIVIAAAPPPAAPTTPAPPLAVLAKPSVVLPRQTANRVTVAVTCQTACTGPARLKVSRRLARRLRLRSRTVGLRQLSLPAGTTTVRVPLRKLVLRKLRTRRIRTVTIAFTVRVKDAGGLQTGVSRSPQIQITRR